MTIFAKYNAAGEITGHYTQEIHESMFDADGAPLTSDLVQLTDEQHQLSMAGRLRVVNGVPEEYVYTPTLDELKTAKWEKIKATRDAEERSPLPYMGALFDFDDTSSERLNWALEAARSAQALGATFSVNWTTADNATITMTASDIIGLPIAVAQRSDALHQKARALRAAIDAATTAEEVAAVSW